MDTLNSMLNDWLRILHQCKIDLQEYGEWEKMHFRTEYHDFVITLAEISMPGSGIQIDTTVSFINFTYGPRLEDWKFWFSEPSDPSAGDFWALIEEGTP